MGREREGVGRGGSDVGRKLLKGRAWVREVRGYGNGEGRGVFGV